MNPLKPVEPPSTREGAANHAASFLKMPPTRLAGPLRGVLDRRATSLSRSPTPIVFAEGIRET
jgi:hypothetical protein